MCSHQRKTLCNEDHENQLRKEACYKEEKEDRQQKKKKIDEKFAEDRHLTKKLAEKFAKQKKKEDDGAVLKFKVKDDKQKVSVENSASHNKIILQAEERHVSKQYQLELRNDALCSQFKCAACSQRSNVDDLGDLFGPYYVPKISKKDEFLIDVWLHGDCVLHLPKVFLHGGELTHLEEVINQSWKNKCVVCHEVGASIIAAASGNAHFPCAKKKGFL
ncbi:unnamed protein product, partial [Mesorhabditis belari]|uniref:PHD-type domain-containing protein n=1 Tax=Mesorhabditis belari TaxID=2138241 RepID=A0AAF3FRU6_9BILA